MLAAPPVPFAKSDNGCCESRQAKTAGDLQNFLCHNSRAKEQGMTTLRYAGLRPTATGAPLKGIGAWIRAGLDWLRAARARRGQSLELAAMSEHDLSDLGIGRSEVPALLAREAVQDRAL